jgi:tRNA nucleotidyltransferase (CCA-adding enzyme)
LVTEINIQIQLRNFTVCQSIKNGGRRCLKGIRAFSNYPHILGFDEKTSTIVLKESIKNRPELALHAAVIAGRSGGSLSKEIVSAGKIASTQFASLSKADLWSQWKDIALAAEPSKALQAIHDMGWEGNFPELAAIRGVPQSPIWHPEGSVEIHTQEAADVAAGIALRDKLSDSETQVAVLGAICHDFGKAVSTQIDKDGNITSSGHAETGAPLASKFLEQIGASKAVKTQVPLIVLSHMSHIHAPSEPSVRKLIKKLDNDGRGTTLEMWTRVADADKGGRGSASSQESIAKSWLEMEKSIIEKDEHSKRLLINGPEIAATGLKSGVVYGWIIFKSKEAQMNGEFSTKEESIAWLNKFVANPDNLVFDADKRMW